MNKKTRQAIKDSIAHHRRMQDWAGKQNFNYEYLDSADIIRRTMRSDIFLNIREDWYCNNCPLCELFVKKECKNCPLALKYGKCNDGNPNAWKELCLVTNWRDWIAADERLINQLESLLEV